MRRARSRRAVLGVLAGLLVSAAALGYAAGGGAAPAIPVVNFVQKIDDRKGDGGFLDIRTAKRGHVAQSSAPAGRPVYAIETYGRWSDRDLGKCADLGFRFPDHARFVEIFLADDTLEAKLKNDTTGRLVGHPKIWRTSRRDVFVSFPASWLGRAGTDQRWRAYAGSPPSPPCASGISAGPGVEVDYAPNRGSASP